MADEGLQREPSDGGRFSLLPFGDTIVMLDAISGDTWILEKNDNKTPIWLPIRKVSHEMTDAVIAAQATSKDELNIQVVPELGTIILRGKKEDVQKTMDALNRKESGRAKAESEN